MKTNTDICLFTDSDNAFAASIGDPPPTEGESVILGSMGTVPYPSKWRVLVDLEEDTT